MHNLLNSIKEQELKNYFLEVSKANNKVKQGQNALTIGVMGKSGAGKSSIINTLCQDNLCKSSAVGGCTREVQHIPARIADLNACLIDFPGIAESEQWDQSYMQLYQDYLDKLDIILWVVKIDDRAVLEDEKFFNKYLSDHKTKQKCIFILSQSDKTEPSREWRYNSFTPSEKQLDNIKRNKFRIRTDFNIDALNVVAVATDYNNGSFKNYNFEAIFDVILFKLANNDAITNELPLQVYWDIVKREGNKSLEFCKYEMEIVREEADKVMSSLEDLLEELE